MTLLTRLAEILVVVMCALAGASLAYGIADQLGRVEPGYMLVGGVAGLMFAAHILRFPEKPA
jgi:type IV secretory pathway VirB2 component (pilin)